MLGGLTAVLTEDVQGLSDRVHESDATLDSQDSELSRSVR
ncbi:hypothetical protein GCM10025865_24610 [Paraoerskovia sediminicola]|uniref:t-SNARE coiled-coil homology domain-containing protein n=1 Tax=Paraoerskovia sediminicola TaxID=1138587 RepID=A0ABN6XDZ7_9CELL|nr:hypothetical protein GCM10025865_24610 [Paraoerskovia sediminicola]